MRVLALAALAIVAGWIAHPAQAQTYDPRYPICLHVYQVGGDRMDCQFTSMEQCAESAAGLSAMCVRNPYYAQDDGDAGPARQRPR
jgi:Protein of unknown function (DUF3551)